MHEVELVTRVITAVQYDVADEPPASQDQPLGRRVYELIVAATLKTLGIPAGPDGHVPHVKRATGKTRRKK